MCFKGWNWLNNGFSFLMWHCSSHLLLIRHSGTFLISFFLVEKFWYLSDSINSFTFGLIEKYASGDLEMESEREDKNPDKGRQGKR